MTNNNSWCALILVSLWAWTVGTTAAQAASDHAPDIRFVTTPNPIQPGIFDVPVIVDDPQDSRREEYRKTFWNAQRSVYNFAHAQGWDSFTEKPFVRQVEIYDSKVTFDKRLRELSEDNTTEIPKTFTGAVEKDILLVVSPEVLDAVYPDGRGPRSHEKLMAHELAHRLQIRLLDGNEDRMGPIWFYEGFATYVADQFPGNKPMSEKEVSAVIESKERGSYRKYNAAFTYFLNKKGVTVLEFIKQAGNPDFTDWLKAH